MCRSRRELSNAYLLAKFVLDTAENEPCQVCPIPRNRTNARSRPYAPTGSLIGVSIAYDYLAHKDLVESLLDIHVQHEDVRTARNATACTSRRTSMTPRKWKVW